MEEMKDRLLKSLKANKKEFEMFYWAAKNTPSENTDYIVSAAECFGKCELLEIILEKEFSVTEAKEILTEMRELYKSLY